MVSTSTHSAAGSAAGYLHQIQKGLVLLWRRSVTDPDCEIVLEGLDDLEIISSTDPGQSIQVKHSVGDGSLTDRGEALWKTLDVWMDRLADRGRDGLPRLMLLTTMSCAPGSAVAALRAPPSRRDDAAGLTGLIAVATEEPGNARTREARRRFTGLPGPDRAALVAAVDVIDGDARVDEFDCELHTIVGMSAPAPESVAALSATVFTWWMQRAALMLARRLDGVTGRELWAQVREQHALIVRAQLTVDDSILSADPGQDERLSLTRQMFVRQVELVTDEPLMLELAVRDFWRARQQRSHWTRTGRLTPTELEDYDRRLQQEWQAAWALMHAQLGDDADAEARCKAGLGLLGALPRDSCVRLPTDFQEPIITRGSLHRLADEPVIGWHPDYEQALGVT